MHLYVFVYRLVLFFVCKLVVYKFIHSLYVLYTFMTIRYIYDIKVVVCVKSKRNACEAQSAEAPTLAYAMH